MDLRVVVSAQLLLLLGSPGPDRHLDVAVGVLATDHEANLSRRIGRDGGVGVLSNREDLLAVLLQVGDEGQVEPLVLSYFNKLAFRTWDVRELIQEGRAGTEYGRLERVGVEKRGSGGWSIVLFMSIVKRIRRSKQDACE